MKKQNNITLPEWAFLDGASHLGNTLEGRDILQHIRTYTMMEIFSTDEMQVQLNSKVKTRMFTYKNSFGVEEKHLIAVHFSLAEFTELDEIIDQAIEFYKEYSDWEDGNIIDEHITQQN